MTIDQELRAAADELLEVVERSPIPQMGDRPYVIELSSEFDLPPVRRDALSERKRWIGALAAVAAAILVVAGVVVVVDRNGGDDASGLASAPDATVPPVSLFGAADPVAAPSVDDAVAARDVTDPAAPPSVIDPVSSYRWTRAPDADFALASMLSVTIGGPGLVAVGVANVEVDVGLGFYIVADAAVWTSVDGVTWSAVSQVESELGGIGDQRMTSVTAGGPGLVAAGSEQSMTLDDGDLNGGWPAEIWDSEHAAVWTSADGLTWSRIVHDESVFGGAGATYINSVAVGGPGLVAVGAQSKAVVHDHGYVRPDESDLDAAVWTSIDGTTWSRVAHDESVFGGTGPQEMASVTAGGPGLVAVGTDGLDNDVDAAVWTSVDGITWSRVVDDAGILGGANAQHMASVTTGGPGLVAVGSDGVVHEYAGSGSTFMSGAAVWTSVDGTTWSRVSDDVAAGWTSVGGTTWSLVPDDSGIFVGAGYQRMISVASGGPGLVAVGIEKLDGQSDVRSAVWTSVDGITWSRVPDDETLFGGRFVRESVGNPSSSAEMTSVTTWGPALVAVGTEMACCSDKATVWIATPES